VTTLAYLPNNPRAESFCAELSDPPSNVNVSLCTTAEEFVARASTMLRPDGAIITHDVHFAEIIESLKGLEDEIPLVILAPHDTISAVQAEVGNHPVIPLPGTPMAACVLLSVDPVNDPGCLLSTFQLTRLVSYGRMTHTFEASQVSIDRPVFLHLLNAEHTEDEEISRDFLADLQAKAKASHETLIPVFQAINDGSRLYYAAEHVRTETLSQVIEEGRSINPLSALRILHAAAASLLHLYGIKVSAHTLEAEHVFLVPEASDQCRIENIAFAGGMTEREHLANLGHFAKTLIHSLDVSNEFAEEVRTWLTAVAEQPSLRDAALDARKTLARLEGRGTIVDPPTHIPGSPNTNLPGRRQKQGAPVGLILGAVALIGAAFYFLSGDSTPKVELRDHNKMVEIAGGVLQTSRGTMDVEPFWIDAYEVTIAQYHEFLIDTDGNPNSSYINHRDQPKTKTSHVPENWDKYYPIAEQGGKYLDHQITLNHPVFGVDWWDAYAYARWKDRRLPTAAEWEFAARGSDDRKFPWGSNWKPENTNSGLDSTKNNSTKPGSIDGFSAWAPVDRPVGDVTPEGAFGLTGNISEWTDTLVPDSFDPDKLVPLIKGGTFYSLKINLSDSKLPKSRSQRSPLVGFRTASSRKPSQ